MSSFFLKVERAKLFYFATGSILLCLTLIASTVGREHFLLPALQDLLVGEADGVSTWLFWQLWLPRALLTIGVGMALAISGNVFQLITKNPLGSPDILGVNAGASAGAVLSAIFFPSYLSMGVGAFFGSLLVVSLVLLANRGKQDMQFEAIVCGIALNAFALSVVHFCLTGLRQENALLLASWLSGSLSGRGWAEVATIWMVLPVVMIALYALNRPLTILSLGGHVSQTLGVQAERVTLISLLLATILSAIAVLVAGPISFIALCAPHLVRKILKTHQSMWLATGLMGSVLLLFADVLARLLPIKAHFPVGVLTAGIGGVYLIALLLTEMHKK